MAYVPHRVAWFLLVGTRSNTKVIRMMEITDHIGELAIAIPTWARVVTAPIVLIGAIYLAIARYNKWVTSTKRRRLTQNEYAAMFLSQFNEDEIDASLKNYIVPQCATADPANREGEEYLADIRQSIFDHMDSNLQKRARSYHLILGSGPVKSLARGMIS